MARARGRRWRCSSRSTRGALWRWRDGANPAVSAVRGAKVSEDVVFPVERLAEGLERFEQIAGAHGMRSCAWGHGGEGNVHATVLVDPHEEHELDAAQAIGGELFALVAELGGSIAGEHGVGWHKRGRLAAQWTRGRSSIGDLDLVSTLACRFRLFVCIKI